MAGCTGSGQSAKYCARGQAWTSGIASQKHTAHHLTTYTATQLIIIYWTSKGDLSTSKGGATRRPATTFTSSKGDATLKSTSTIQSSFIGPAATSYKQSPQHPSSSTLDQCSIRWNHRKINGVPTPRQNKNETISKERVLLVKDGFHPEMLVISSHNVWIGLYPS